MNVIQIGSWVIHTQYSGEQDPSGLTFLADKCFFATWASAAACSCQFLFSVAIIHLEHPRKIITADNNHYNKLSGSIVWDFTKRSLEVRLNGIVFKSTLGRG